MVVRKRSRRLLRRGALTGLALATAIAAMLVPATPGNADPSDDKQQVDRQLAQTQAELESVTDRARQAINEYNEATAALPQAEATLADARGRVLAAQAAARQADREATEARAAADRAAEEFRQAAAEVDRGRREVSHFVAATYRGSTFTALNAMLEAGSPSDLANRIGYLDHVAETQRRALDELTAARMVARQRSDVADAARQRADDLAAAAERALQDALAYQASAEQAAATVKTLADQKSRAANVAEQERGAVLSRYNDLKAQSDQLAVELREAARRATAASSSGGGSSGGGNSGGGSSGGGSPGGGSSGGGSSRGGYFMMPVSGWKSSDFGMRYDPYYHVWQLHAGTDFAAGGGSPIVAAAAGQVVRTGWNGGYGNYTCIYHGTVDGRGLSTCYAHQSAILVSTGQYVERGQLIGRVGTTGASTGNHLHFEVRLDGTPVNPLGWLPGCLC